MSQSHVFTRMRVKQKYWFCFLCAKLAFIDILNKIYISHSCTSIYRQHARLIFKCYQNATLVKLDPIHQTTHEMVPWFYWMEPELFRYWGLAKFTCTICRNKIGCLITRSLVVLYFTCTIVNPFPLTNIHPIMHKWSTLMPPLSLY